MTIEWTTIGPCRLACGDCLEILPTLEAGSVDAVITDPPYGMSYQSSWRIDVDRFDKIENDERPFVWWCHRAFALTRDCGCVLCFCRWDDSEAFRSALTWSGFSVRSQIIWDRGNHGLGDLLGAPAPRHDTVWFGTRGRFKFHGRRPPSVVAHMRVGGDALRHPNEKPTGLMVELVDDYSPKPGVVLDPFMGSGTTGVACVKAGRRFIGIEIDRRYYDMSCKRIERAIADGALFSGVEAKATQQQMFDDQTEAQR